MNEARELIVTEMVPTPARRMGGKDDKFWPVIIAFVIFLFSLICIIFGHGNNAWLVISSEKSDTQFQVHSPLCLAAAWHFYNTVADFLQ